MIEILMGLGGLLLALVGALIAVWGRLQHAKDKGKQAHAALNSFQQAKDAQDAIIEQQRKDDEISAGTITNRHYFGE